MSWEVTGSSIFVPGLRLVEEDSVLQLPSLVGASRFSASAGEDEEAEDEMGGAEVAPVDTGFRC